MDEEPTCSLPAAGAPKKSKSPWPPVTEGKCFFVEKTDAEKWPKAKYTSEVARAKFTVTAFGVRCCEEGCRHAGFAEVSPGETNHVSSLHACAKHAAAYHPPAQKQPRVSSPISDRLGTWPRARCTARRTRP